MKPVKSSISKALVSCRSAAACDWVLVRDEMGEWVTEVEVAATIGGRVAGGQDVFCMVAPSGLSRTAMGSEDGVQLYHI